MPTLQDLYARRFEQALDATTLPQPVDLTSASTSPAQLSLRICKHSGKVHPGMTASTDFWSYNQMVPGPVIVSKTGQRVRVQFENQLKPDDILPFESYNSAVDSTSGTAKGMDHTGSNKADAKTERLPAFKVRPWTVTHLHGAPSQSDSDGWTDNMAGAGEMSEKLYEFPRETYTLPNAGGIKEIKGGVAPTLWYHDHAMSITRYNVYAGLAGMWLLRHSLEKDRDLPNGQHEIPLVIQDRNFETEGGRVDGQLTGKLLHKNHTDFTKEPPDMVMEAFAPATLVNGLLWPKCRVGPHLHRLRIVNGSNARFYRLHFMGVKGSIPENRPDHNFPRDSLSAPHVLQIGTDGGLLAKAIGLTLNPTVSDTAPYLLLAPGERADVLIDCGRLVQEGYHHIEVLNSAPAPYGGESALAGSVGDANPDGLLPYPAVVRFDFVAGEHDPKPVNISDLDHEFHRITHEELKEPNEPEGHAHIVIALREEDGKLFMYEMEHTVEGKHYEYPLTLLLPNATQTATESWTAVAREFNDRTSIFLKKGSWSVWKIVNLSPDTHPFHIHLVQFQALKRELLVPVSAGAIGKDETRFEFQAITTPQRLDDNEIAWKDTVRVNPGRRDANDNIEKAEMLTLAAPFSGHAGRYMYHCHILEHEDFEMMRPFIVMPPELHDLMPAHGGAHG